MTLKCDYCDSATHVEVDCQKRKVDRRLEATLAFVTISLLFFFSLIGGIIGAIWGAMRAGFKFTEDFWPEAWKSVRVKRKDGGQSGGETS